MLKKVAGVLIIYFCDSVGDTYERGWGIFAGGNYFIIKFTYNPGQKSLGQYRNIHIFLSYLSSLLKQCILF